MSEWDRDEIEADRKRRPVGWMAKQAEEIRREIATWPRWMRIAAQFERRPLPQDKEPKK